MIKAINITLASFLVAGVALYVYQLNTMVLADFSISRGRQEKALLNEALFELDVSGRGGMTAYTVKEIMRTLRMEPVTQIQYVEISDQKLAYEK